MVVDNILDPDFEMLEDIEIQEMETVTAKEAKKRKVPLSRIYVMFSQKSSLRWGILL